MWQERRGHWPCDNCLPQLIRDPTYCCGRILDWIVLKENNGSVSKCKVLSTSFSDHDAFVGLTVLGNSLTHCRVVSSRNLRKINSAKMQADIQHLHDIELSDCSDSQLAVQAFGLMHAPCPGPARSPDQQECDQPSGSPLEDRQRQDGQKGTPPG